MVIPIKTVYRQTEELQLTTRGCYHHPPRVAIGEKGVYKKTRKYLVVIERLFVM